MDQNKTGARINSGAAMGRNRMINAMKFLFLLVNVALYIGQWLLKQQQYAYYAKTSVLMAALQAVFIIFLERTYGGWKIGERKLSDLLFSQVLVITATNAVLFVIEYLTTKSTRLLWYSFISFGAQMVFSLIWCVAANGYYVRSYPPVNTVIVCCGGAPMQLLDDVRRDARRFHVIETLDISGYSDLNAELERRLAPAEAVFLGDMPSPVRNDILKFCVDRGITAYVRPKIGDMLISRGEDTQMFHLPVLRCGRKERSILYIAVKRLFDILLSLIGVIITSPIMIGTAIAIKINDGGHIFYCQERLTKNGKIFKIIKFRSMREDAEKDGVARLASANDDRITPVGKFIRAVRIDELPQLFNILIGDMSIVGPRPERPSIAEKYARELPEFNLRLQVKAGLTGYAQVHGKYNTTPYDKLLMDLMYIANQGVVQDIQLIFQTVKILFEKESTEGVADGQTTASRGEESA